MNDKLLKHIDYIVSVAEEDGYKLTTIRIVKFLYLLDILYIKYTGSRLTDWTWKFWDYGPYCLESLEILKEAKEKSVVLSTSHTSSFDEERDYDLFSCVEEHSSDRERHIEELGQDIPAAIQVAIKSYIRTYGNDTPKLLDYVYFNTKPMENARPRENLDFSMLSKGFKERISPSKLSKSKIKKAKQAIREMTKKMLERKNEKCVLINPEHIDSSYIEGMKILNQIEESEDDIDESGYASIASLNDQTNAHRRLY